jgi:hypothetical protein
MAAAERRELELVLAALLFVVAAVALIAVLVLAVVVVGIRQEPVGTEMARRAPRATAALARWLLGVHVRRTGGPDDTDVRQGSCLAGRGSEGDRR